MGCCPSRRVTAPAEEQIPQQIVPQRQESASVEKTAAEVSPAVGEVTVGGRRPSVTELDVLRQLTEDQAAANAKAAEHIGEVAATMENVPEEEQKPALYYSGDPRVYWGVANGDRIEAALEHTPLIDLEYLVMLGRLGGVMPCGRQNVPPAAFITKRNLWRIKQWGKRRGKYTLGVLVLSYPWLDWFHPDRLGAQLRRLLPIFEAMLADAKYDSPHCTIGVMIDFLCLPQRPFASDEESAQFTKSLKNINTWYFHPFAPVLLVTTPPPEGAEYGNTRLHKERGWCFFEQAAATAIKHGHCVLDFGRYDGATEWGDLKSPDSCVGQMMGHRQPPISPTVFAAQMRAAVASGELAFTAHADQEFVIDQYRTGFIDGVNGVASQKDSAVRALQFIRLNWGDAEFAVLLEAMRYAAQHCEFPCGGIEVHIFHNQSCLGRGTHKEEWAELRGKFTKVHGIGMPAEDTYD